MWEQRVKTVAELTLRCLLLAVIDTILAQRVPMTNFFMLCAENTYMDQMMNISFYLTWWLLNVCLFTVALALLFVRVQYLTDAFTLLSCIAMLFLSYGINQAFVQFYQVEPGTLWKYYYVFFVFGIQFTLASIYILLRTRALSQQYGIFSYKPFCEHWSFVFHLLFLVTSIYYFLGISTHWLEWLPILSSFWTAVELLTTIILRIPEIAVAIEKYITKLRTVLREHGVQILIETQWARLRVPTLLQTYWISRILIETVLVIIQEQSQEDEIEEINLSLSNVDVNNDHVQMNYQMKDISRKTDYSVNTTYIDFGYIKNTTQSVLLKGCDGVVPLLGMTTIVSKITHYLGLVMAALVDSNSDDDKNMGTMCGILFFVLALQTGLTRLEPSKRLIRLYRNVCLLSTAILHFVHSMVHPILMTISASKTPWPKHMRVLGMCLFLVLFPIVLLRYLWSDHVVSPWLLAVTAFSIEIVIKVVISLLIYSLFMIDSHSEVFWEKLDDYIYYIKATGNSIEFLFGIFLFCNGGWIMISESGGMIRAFMMCIHAYFNIWMQARDGWKVFIQRRSAVKKINSLPNATREQLEAHNDVCAICFQDLETAKVTRCRHLFHSVCLRKWLYHQDRCPMCHKPIYQPTSQETSGNNNVDGNVIEPQAAQRPHQD